MRKSLLILLIGSLFFWTGFSVSFAASPISTNVDSSSDNPLIINGVNLWGSAVTSPTPWRNSPWNAAYDEAMETSERMDARPATTNDNSLGWGSNGGSNDLMSPEFTLNPGQLSPSTERYDQKTVWNLKTLLMKIGNILLIATSTLAVLSIVVGGVMIATTGPSDRAAKGKTIITLNIIAIFVALFSYSLIRLVSWIIAA